MNRYLLPLCLVFAATLHAADKEALKAELVRAENEFCRQAAAIGIPEAFAANMAEQCFNPGAGTLTRSEFVKARIDPTATRKDDALTWEPIFVDVSDDGTLGYTWGKYEHTGKGADGQAKTTAGIYLTIWKRQPDGSWRFVFDGGPRMSPEAVQKLLARADLPKPGTPVKK